MDGMLSQEEINALLSGMEQSDTSSVGKTSDFLTDSEKDAVGEISNISMGTAATTLSTLVNTKVVITTPMVSYSTLGELSKQYDRPCVFIQISYKEGLDGKNILVLKENDVKIITDLMMGGDGSNISDELSDLHLSAISEAMNQMMGSAATSISSMIMKKVDISPPVASLIDLNDSIEEDDLSSFLSGEFVKVSFQMVIGDLVDSQIMHLYPIEFVKQLYKQFTKSEGADYSDSDQAIMEESQPSQNQPQQSFINESNGNNSMPQMMNMNQQMQGEQVQMMGQPMMGQPMMGQPMMGQPMMGQPMMGQPMMGQPMMGQPMMGQMPGMQYGMPMQDVNVHPAQFQAFSNDVNPFAQKENIDLIMDVPLEVTVELGRTNKTIKEILDFAPGTIIELNKLAGEPIDVLVNGKFVAKGEVVVIEESFGIRVTEIIR